MINCWYSVFNSTGGIDGATSENTSITCNSTGTSETVSGFASFNLTLYANDSANNINSTTTEFTTSPSPTSPPGEGGGITIITTGLLQALAGNFSIFNTGLGNTLDLILAKGSVRPRSKTFILTNTGIEPVELDLICDTTDIPSNISEGSRTDIDICEYVVFEETPITISPNIDSPTIGKMFVFSPEDAEFGDRFTFNVLAIREIDSNISIQFAKLSVTARVPLVGSLLRWQYYPLQLDTPDDEKAAYPVIIPSIVLGLSVFSGIVFFLRKRALVTGFILGVIAGSGVFLAVLFFI